MTAVFGPTTTSVGSVISTVIVNVSLPSTIMSSVTVISRHTELPTAVVEGIVRTSFANGIKSLAPEKENAICIPDHFNTCMHGRPIIHISFNAIFIIQMVIL